MASFWTRFALAVTQIHLAVIALKKRVKFELQSRRIIDCIEAIVFSIVQTISEMFVAIISDVVSGQTMLRCHSTTLSTTTSTNNISIQ